ncbi:MAG: type IV pilin protein [Candidatus Microsaccharimonas sp.]
MDTMKSWAQKQTGFTIVELLIVIVVIAILAAITIVSYNGITKQAQRSVVAGDVRNVNQQIEGHRILKGAFPGSITDCPTPATGSLCYPSGATTVTYKSIIPATDAYTIVTDASYEVSVQADKAFSYYSPAEKTGIREFMQFTDLAPYIDKYGLVPYVLSFDIKSANSGVSSMSVYFQNGSLARHGGLTRSISVTNEWAHHEIEFTPSLSYASEAKSMLAFYGTYNTGNIPSVRNVQFELK